MAKTNKVIPITTIGILMQTTILRLKTLCQVMGLARSTIYLRIKQGLLIKPFSLGGKAVGWPTDEIQQIITARIAGCSDKEIAELVKKIESARSNSGKEG